MKNQVWIVKRNTATFLVDAQKGFTPLCPNELPVPDGQNIVDECLKTFAKTDFKIASKDAHPFVAEWITKDPTKITQPVPNHGKQTDLLWPAHCTVGTDGFEFIPGLPDITEFDFIVYKGVEYGIHVYSAIYHLLNANSHGNKISTGVIEFLKTKEINTVIITGLATNYCCMATAIDLKLAGFDVILNLAACRGIGDNITLAINIMKEIGVKIVDSADDIIVVR